MKKIAYILLSILLLALLFSSCKTNNNNDSTTPIEKVENEVDEEINDNKSKLKLPDIMESGVFSTDESKNYDNDGNEIGSGTSWYTWNENIPESVESEISQLDEILYNCILNIDVDTFIKYTDEKSFSSYDKIKQLLELYNGNIKNRQNNSYLKCYAQVFYEGNFSSSLFHPESDMVLSYTGYTTEMYISLISAYDDVNESLISFVYGKQKDGWKIYYIYINDISYSGLNAIDMYEKSKELKQEGYLVPALLFQQIFNVVDTPAPFINYNSLKDSQAFYQDLYNEVSQVYSFPITLESDNEITFYNISMDPVTTGFMPIFSYTTSIEVNEENEELLNEEVYAFHEEVMGLFPGMSETFDYFLYRAYVEPPLDPNKGYAGFATLVDETKQ